MTAPAEPLDASPFRQAPAIEMCSTHGRIPATLRCTRCRTPLCDACFSPLAGSVTCLPCAAPIRRRIIARRVLNALAALIGLGAVIGAVVISKQRAPSRIMIGAPTVGGRGPTLFDDRGRMLFGDGNVFRGPVFGALQHLSDQTASLVALRDRWSTEPCDLALTLGLASKLFHLERHAETVALGRRYARDCAREDVVEERVFFAHEELAEWAAADRVVSGLIAARPRVPTYWWWRGRIKVAAGRLDEAFVDLLTGIDDYGLGWNSEAPIDDLARMAALAGRPCPAAFALRAFDEANAGQADWAVKLQRELEVTGNCSRDDGQGTARLPAVPGEPAAGEARVAGQPATLWIDRSTPLTVVSRALAERAGVTPGPAVEIMLFGQLTRGRLARVAEIDLGGARAERIDVVIVDDAPRGLDGVVGGDFLRRFRLAYDDDAIRLRGRAVGEPRR